MVKSHEMCTVVSLTIETEQTVYEVKPIIRLLNG